MERHSSAYHSHSYIHVFHTFIYKNCMNKHFLAFVVVTCVCVCLCSVERLRSQDAMNGIVYVAHCRRTTLMPGVHTSGPQRQKKHTNTHTHSELLTQIETIPNEANNKNVRFGSHFCPRRSATQIAIFTQQQPQQ